MKDKEVEKIKEVNSRNVRRKARRGTINKEEVLNTKKKTVTKQAPKPKKVLKVEKVEKKREEVKVTKEPVKEVKVTKEPVKEVKVVKEPKVIKKNEVRKSCSNKAPYVFFSIISILYFAVSICLVGYTSYKAVATIRAKNNNNLDSYVTEKLIKDEIVFEEDNVTLYNENHFDNSKVITYYFLVLATVFIVSFLLAIIFSYLSEFFSDHEYENPFKVECLNMVKSCAYLAVAILCVSTFSAAFQMAFTPFKISVVAFESIFVIAIATICGYIVLKRGNELTKE